MKQFGSNKDNYPDEMRTQLWPLCCGAAIMSGFKAVGNMSEQELLAKITSVADECIPDHQVYVGETMRPGLLFLTLNSSQMGSKKIMDAIKAAGFVQFAEGQPRGHKQGFFVRDKSKTFAVMSVAA